MIQIIEYYAIPPYILEHSDVKKYCLNISPANQYIGWFINGEVVGIAGWRRYANKVVLHAGFVLPRYRGQGIYTRLFKWRENLFTGVRKETHATEHSIGTFLKHNYEIIKQYKTTYKVCKDE